MKVITEMSLNDFNFWSGGIDTVEELTSDELNTIQSYLEEIYPDGLTETEINDFLWLERDFIAELLGYSNFDEIMDQNRMK